MGFFWDLLQQSQISEHSNRAATLDLKVQNLEKELFQTQVSASQPDYQVGREVRRRYRRQWDYRIVYFF